MMAMMSRNYFQTMTNLTLVLGALSLFTSCNLTNSRSIASSDTSSPSTNTVFTKQFGVAGNAVEGYAVHTDSSDNVIIVGVTTIGINSNTLSGSGAQDVYVIKYDSQGNTLWTSEFGGGSGATVTPAKIATDASNNIYVSGSTTTALPGNTQSGASDAFIAKFNSSGVRQWIKQIGPTIASSNSTYANGLKVDSSGNTYFAGYTTGALVGNSAMIGTFDGVIGELDSSGNIVFVQQFGAASDDVSVTGLDRDASTGDLYVSGSTTVTLNSNPLNGSADAFIGKFNSSGTKQWVSQFGGAGGSAITMNVFRASSGNIYFGGGTTSAGVNGNTLIGSLDIFTGELNSAGTVVWITETGVASQSVQPYDIAGDNSGNVYLSGYTTGGLGGHTQAGAADAVVLKYGPTGSLLWVEQMGSTGNQTAGVGVAIDSSLNVFIAGFTTGGINGNTQTGSADTFVAKYSSSGTIE